eukprot:scaffold247430_cov26-Tisochrysis_lutea.AAC.3
MLQLSTSPAETKPPLSVPAASASRRAIESPSGSSSSRGRFAPATFPGRTTARSAKAARTVRFRRSMSRKVSSLPWATSKSCQAAQ